jgi:hypothetical protein
LEADLELPVVDELIVRGEFVSTGASNLNNWYGFKMLGKALRPCE